MTEDCRACRAYVDRLLDEKDRWIETQFEALHRGLDLRFEGSDRHWAAKLEAVEATRLLALRAVDKAEEQIRERLAQMNEMRQQLDRQAGSFATQKELDALQSVIDKWRGVAVVGGAVWTAVVVVLSVLIQRAWITGGTP